MKKMMNVPFLDLSRQHTKINKKIGVAVKEVVDRSDFILGRDVGLFEQEFASYCGAAFGVGLNSGTDALFLSLLAAGVGPHDEVIVPAFTFIATANAVTYTGARPVFADIDGRTFTIDPLSVKKAITKKTKAIIPVHLFGQCADMGEILKIAGKHRLKVIEDACQAHGAEYMPQRKRAGGMGDVGCFSFYPTKNLGGFGDGGMAVTSDAQIHEKLKRLRDCGRKSRYEHVIVGYNSRLDTVQAALLRLKLPYLDVWNQARARHARRYDSLLSGIPGLAVPFRAQYSSHVFHIYAVLTAQREEAVNYLKKHNIGVMVNYPIPLHLQKAYTALGYRKGDFPAAEEACRKILSLPMHPGLTDNQVRYVADCLKSFFERQ